MGQIFYSEVDKNLQKELNARGKAGKSDRTTKSLDYMIGKIANVELSAYKSQSYKPEELLHVLGGHTTRRGDYLPSGYLNPKRELLKISESDMNKNGTNESAQYASIAKNSTKISNNTYKIPPVITSCDISMNDHSHGLLNSATISITILNPDLDLDFMESIFAKPGRAVKLRIEYPDSAVITKSKLDNAVIKPTPPASAIVENELKMNAAHFNGLIISFGLSYQQDGSIDMTLHLRGTSAVHTDVTLLTNTSTETQTGEPIGPVNFYQTLMDEVKLEVDNRVKYVYQSVDKLLDETKTDYGIEHDNDRWSFVTNDTMHGATTEYYIMLGELIHRLNKYITVKVNGQSKNAYILCTDKYCFSNTYPDLVSIDPYNILIPGNYSVYGIDANNNNRYYSPFMSSDTNLSAIKFNDKDQSYPTRIFINLQLVKSIIDKLKIEETTFKISDFLTTLSDKINVATCGAISLTMISHPTYTDTMLFYDKNFIGNSTVTPYSIPMMANHPHGTIVTDFQFEAKLPSSVQGLMYAINSNPNASEEQIAPYMNFMYNNQLITRKDNVQITSSNVNSQSELKKLEEKYEKNHNDFKKALADAKKLFGDTPTSIELQEKLEGALKKYLQYPTHKLIDSSKLQSPVYPYEVSFTIQGVNGFRYGDSLQFDMLPQKYKTSTVFSIISIIHTINTSGEWTTAIKCIMRPKF